MKRSRRQLLYHKYHKIIFLLISLIFFNSSISKATSLEKKYPLQNKISSILKQYPSMQGIKMGIYAVSLKNGKELVNFSIEELFIPASNQKLFTTAAALVKLGPNFSFPTIVSAHDLDPNGIISGPLFIKGFGDPLLVNEELWELCRQLQFAGVKKVLGDLIFDDSYFDLEGKTNNYNRSAASYYAKSNALSINFSTVAFFIRPAFQAGLKAFVQSNPSTHFINIQNRCYTSKDSSSAAIAVLKNEDENSFILSGKIPLEHPQVTIYRAIDFPSQYTAVVFKEMLAQLGITISGSINRGFMSDRAKIIYQHQSRPLSMIIASLNKMSNNFIAQQILKTMGAEIRGQPGTTEKGLLVIEDFLKEAGLNTKQFIAEDGCGLSRKNFTSPKMIVDLLAYMYQNFNCQPEYLASLAIGGVDGTLEKRFYDIDIRGKVRAKTGLLKGVCTLSGYAFSKRYGIIAFSILMNGKKDQQNMCKKIQDQIISYFLK